MPPRRIQRQGDDEHPASKAAAAQQKKKPPQQQQKKKAPPARKRPAPGHADPAPDAEPDVADAPEEAPAPAAPSPAPVRKSKRQQREEEELAALAAAAQGPALDSDSEDDGEEDAGPAAPSTSAFASLQLEDADADDEPRKKAGKKKKKKRATDARAEDGADIPVPTVGTFALTADPDGEDHPLMAKKRAKPKAPQPAITDNTSAKPERVASASTPTTKTTVPKEKKKKKKAKVDEFEAALAELAKRVSASQPGVSAGAQVQGPAPNSRAYNFCDLLSVSLKDMDASAELKRFFGSRVVQAAQSSSSADTPRRTKHGKGALVQPQTSWAPAGARSGLTAVPHERPPGWAGEPDLMGGERWWTVCYDTGYVGDTWRFVEAVKTMDPQNLVDLLRRAPWHADTLLQVSEYYRHRDEHAPASDLVERAIFAYERALGPGPARFAVGRDRLDFRLAENRPLFLALGRHVVNLVRRGVSRAAFEAARFLLSLDPWTDPQGVLLHLDFLALKAGQRDWLLQMWDVWPEGLRRWPGWWYARVLCINGEEERRNAMREAVGMFPEVLPLLADKADVVLPGEVLSLPVFRIALAPTPGDATQSLVHLLAHVYADRSADLWKEHASLLRSAVSPPPALAPERKTLLYPVAQQEAVYRHVVQFEAKRAWQAFLPPRVRARVGYLWDPLPPPASTAYTDGSFFDGVQIEADEAQDEELLMGQLRGMWAQIPMLADMFPDPMRFAEMLRDAPAEAMGILAQAREQIEGGEGEAREPEGPAVRPFMEVQFVPDEEADTGVRDDEEGSSEEESEDEEDETRDTRGFAQRILQGLFGWSAPRHAEAEEGQDEDEDEDESSEDGEDPNHPLRGGHEDDVD